MTWQKIFQTKNYQEYIRKAEKQKFVYILYSTEPPYLPIDLAYSLYEIALKYNIPITSVYRQYYKGQKNREHEFTIEAVFLN